jgi:hypothetical protein
MVDQAGSEFAAFSRIRLCLDQSWVGLEGGYLPLVRGKYHRARHKLCPSLFLSFPVFVLRSVPLLSDGLIRPEYFGGGSSMIPSKLCVLAGRES